MWSMGYSSSIKARVYKDLRRISKPEERPAAAMIRKGSRCKPGYRKNR